MDFGSMIMAAAPAIIPGAATYFGQKEANATNREIAEQNRTFQANQSSTAYQRAVVDMKAAGLNPMLAYSQGGASTSPGSTATMMNAVGEGVNSAVTGYMASKNAELISQQAKTQESQQELNKAIGLKAVSEAEVATASAAEIKARTPVYSMQIAEAMARIDKIAEETKLTFNQALLVKKQIVNAVLTGENISVDTGNKMADNQLKALAYTLGKTHINKAQNFSNAADTWWGRNISPFLPDFLNSSAGVKNAVSFSK